jgi:hypothetical protein
MKPKTTPPRKRRKPSPNPARVIDGQQVAPQVGRWLHAMRFND